MKYDSIKMPGTSPLRVVSLFSGIGGFEAGFKKAGHRTIMMCESDPFARAVLRRQFPDVELTEDVKSLSGLPECDVVTAGWPCQDISLAGTTSGLSGSRSGLIEEVFRLVRGMARKPRYILLENVAFAVELRKGEAVRYVTDQLTQLGYNWAYRILDSRLFGLPQRRRRLYVLACLDGSPGSLLFNGVSAPAVPADLEARKIGFYWTEGTRGTGWSPDAVPPLKGGSALGIPSPPAIWNRDTGTFVQPSIEDAERLQGFPAGWTSSAGLLPKGERKRWMLVGNAVSVPVITWIAARLEDAAAEISNLEMPPASPKKYARAGQSSNSAAPLFFEPTREGPAEHKIVTLDDFTLLGAKDLSRRALAGFTSRFEAAPLKKNPEFLRDLRQALAARG